MPVGTVGEVDLCAYCGSVATSLDHVVPRHFLERMVDSGINHPLLRNGRVLVVPSCRECNVGLGGQFFRTFAERREWVHRWLRKRYRRLIEMPEWTEAQLAQMGPVMRQHIRSSQRKRDIILERLAWSGPALCAVDASELLDLYNSTAGQAAKPRLTGAEELPAKASE
jgi:hypothetical protein